MAVEITGLSDVVRVLNRLKSVSSVTVPRALNRCGLLAVREAKANAPRSPTMFQVSMSLKRKFRTKRRTTPGGLEKSIEYDVQGDRCSVFVSSNSFAGKYAKRIHDERGKTWRNLGPGSIAKGGKVGDKFIERAIKDNEGKFQSIFESEIRKAMKQ